METEVRDEVTTDPWGHWWDAVQGVTGPPGGFVHAFGTGNHGDYVIDLCVSGYTVEKAERAAVEAVLRFPFEAADCDEPPAGVCVHLRRSRKDGHRHPARKMPCRCHTEKRADGGFRIVEVPLLLEALVPEYRPQSREHTAQHEAGHHVVALAMGADICSVTLAPEDAREGSLGTVRHRLPLRHVMAGTDTSGMRAVVSLAGPEAGRRFRGDSFLVALCAESYTDKASALKAVGAQGFRAAWQEASTILDRHWPAVEAVRDLLLRGGEPDWHTCDSAAFRADRDLEKVFWEAKDGGPRPWHEKMRVGDHDEPEE